MITRYRLLLTALTQIEPHTLFPVHLPQIYTSMVWYLFEYTMQRLWEYIPIASTNKAQDAEEACALSTNVDTQYGLSLK